MKKLLFFFALILFFLPAQAQKGDDCPAVDWVKTITSDTDLYLHAWMLPTKDGGEVVMGYYYQGCQNIAGKSVPPIHPNINVQWGNMFLMKADSNGRAEWVLPFEITDVYDSVTPRGLDFQFIMDEKENIHITTWSNGQKFEFLGKSYGLAQPGLDPNGNKFEYYFKINTKGQLLQEYGFEIWANGKYAAPVPILAHANSSDSSLILLYGINSTRDSLSILGMPKIPALPHGGWFIVKANAQFQVEWIKTTTNFMLTGLFQDKNSNEIHLLGSLNTTSADYNTSVTIDNQRYPTRDSMKGGLFHAKINAQTGNINNFNYLIEGNYGIHNRLLEGGQAAAPQMFPDGSSRTFPTNTIPITIDNDSNVYIVGQFWDSLYINQQGFIKLGKLTIEPFLLKYNLNTQNKELFFLGFKNTAGLPFLLRYMSKSNQLLLAGFLGDKFIYNQKTINGGGNFKDLYILSLDPNSATISDLSERAKQLKNNWLIYTTPSYEDSLMRRTSLGNLFEDKQGNIHVVGHYAGTFNWDWRNMNVVLDYNEKHAGNYHAKLTALTSYIQHDATRMRAAQENAQYQWYDCENGMQAVSGATDRYFTPPNVNGKYAVKVSNTWCSVMSDCQKLSVPLVNDLQSVQIYPNPVSHTLYLSNLPIGVDIAVFDVMGRKIFTSSVQQSSFKISTESWAQGVYLVQLNYQGERWMEKVVK